MTKEAKADIVESILISMRAGHMEVGEALALIMAMTDDDVHGVKPERSIEKETIDGHK